MGLSTFYGPPKSDEERLAVLKKAHQIGETFWDTAAVYGDSEELLGKWFAANPEKRNDIFLATKFGIDFVDGKMEINSSRASCMKSCERSLKRLGLQCIDLFYAHRLDPQTPVEETVQAMVELKQQGKIKYLGLSEVSSDTLRRACKLHHITAVQIEYSPFSLDIESDQVRLLETARELGVAIVAYSPLSRGILSGQILSPDDFAESDYRRYLPRYSKENFPKNLELVNNLNQIASVRGCTASQLTLAWLLAQGDDIFPIPGTTKIPSLVENFESLNVDLSPEEVKQIRDFIEETEVQGSRYPEAQAATLFVDTVLPQ
jgi:aryl-alcohol dehydrogenase-like predicted oxidoreductase